MVFTARDLSIRIGIWKYCLLWREENWRTRRKTIGARRETQPTHGTGLALGWHWAGIEPGGRRALSPLRHPNSPSVV